jgi:hypothetical protein
VKGVLGDATRKNKTLTESRILCESQSEAASARIPRLSTLNDANLGGPCTGTTQPEGLLLCRRPWNPVPNSFEVHNVGTPEERK